MKYTRAKILSNKKIVDGIYEMVVAEDSIVKPGQFYMLKHQGGTLLPRPISVSESKDGKITFVYATVGKGTHEFATLTENDYIDLTGPLGNGFDIDRKYGNVALVAGGIGIAPMVMLSRELRKRNKKMKLDLYAGFRDEIYLINEMCEYINEGYVSTNTGKYGYHGFITDILKVDEYDTVLCCGPEVMMKKVVEMCKKHGVQVFVSMEKHMACGVGACLVCTCKTKDGNKRTCKDGPVFDGNYVEL
mgnify:FL=1|nr:dihydroorotate dehydrogenase electron transfer subunit [uncultured Clostridium sp.]